MGGPSSLFVHFVDCTNILLRKNRRALLMACKYISMLIYQEQTNSFRVFEKVDALLEMMFSFQK